MAKVSKTKKVESSKTNPIRPAISEDARENQLIYLATELAEKQLCEGTASSQVIAHFLKLGSSKEKLNKEILKKQVDYLGAKTESLQTSKRIEELYANAIEAMRTYNGTEEANSDGF